MGTGLSKICTSVKLFMLFQYFSPRTKRRGRAPNLVREMNDPEQPQHHFKPFRGPAQDGDNRALADEMLDPDGSADPDTTTGFAHQDPAAPGPEITGLLPSWAETNDDEYADFEAEVTRIEQLFANPSFKAADEEREATRRAAGLRPPRHNSANGSVGRAVALGFANVFDPDRVKDDIVYMQERGDGDGDVPETTIDPDDPKHTRIVFRGKRKKK